MTMSQPYKYYNRKFHVLSYFFQALNMCGVLLFYYGLLSSIAPNFLWLLFLRGLVGFAIGCVPQS